MLRSCAFRIAKIIFPASPRPSSSLLSSPLLGSPLLGSPLLSSPLLSSPLLSSPLLSSSLPSSPQPFQLLVSPVRAHRSHEHFLQSFRSAAKLRHAAFRHNPSVIDNRGMVAQPLHHFEHMRCQKNRRAVVYLIEKNFFHQTRAHRIHALERLIHQK